VAHLLGEVVEEFSTAEVEVGPVLPLSGGETAEELQSRLLQLLDGFDNEAPFTMQRLAEVLLEPRKQYKRLDKLVSILPQSKSRLPCNQKVVLSRSAGRSVQGNYCALHML